MKLIALSDDIHWKALRTESSISDSVYVMETSAYYPNAMLSRNGSWDTIYKADWWKPSAVAYFDAVPGKFPSWLLMKELSEHIEIKMHDFK